VGYFRTARLTSYVLPHQWHDRAAPRKFQRSQLCGSNVSCGLSFDRGGECVECEEAQGGFVVLFIVITWVFVLFMFRVANSDASSGITKSELNSLCHRTHSGCGAGLSVLSRLLFLHNDLS